MAKHKVEITGLTTSNIEVLTQEEMEALFKKLKEGDLSVRNRLVEGNFRLVLSILQRFHNKNENMDDLFQVGCIGLLKAIDNFDLSYGVMFSTYCVPMVLGEIKRYLRDNNSLRVSRSIKDIAYKSLKFKEEYIMEHGIEPSFEQIAKTLGVSYNDVVLAMQSLKPTVSLFEPIYNDGGDTIYVFDQIEDKKENKDLDVRLAVDKALRSLPEREQYIIDQRFIVGKTQMEIANDLGISQAQISRLEKNALVRVKKQI